jgi:hypothetical protein
MTHYPWPSIEQFKNVRRNVQAKAQFTGLFEAGEPIMDRTAVLPTLSYEGTIKIHGTNSALCLINDGTFYCQSRERILSITQDNCGFFRWVSSLPAQVLDSLRAQLPENWNQVVIYGEWAGKGVQGGVALAEVEKCFIIFGAKSIVGGETVWLDVREWKTPSEYRIFKIYDFPTYKIDINFETPEYAVDQINKWVLEVEAECPVGKALGVSGIGEGLVFRCLDEGYKCSGFWFKCKGQAHSQSKVKKFATVDIEKFESLQAFTNSVLDEERLEQGYRWLAENNKEQTEKSTGDFIRWVFNDVLKECKLEMEANNVVEKDLGKLLAVPAKKWYFTRLNK